MIFILDTCTINNLLQIDLIDNDEDYELEYDYLDKINQVFKIKLSQKNYDELKNTFSKNFSDGNKIKFIRNYMSKNIPSYLNIVDNVDFDSSLNFIKKVCPKYKDEDNGELHSTAYALYLNRYESSLAFQTYFITDDDEAIQDFQDIFRSNFLGEVFTTIDLLLILSIYEIISYKNVMDFAHNLKKQYIQNYTNVLNEIQTLQKKNLPTKEIAFLSKLHEDIHHLDFDKVQKNMEKSEYISIKRKQTSIDIFLKNLLNEDLKKVTILDKKIEEIKSKYWTTDKI
ncbi:MAG: Unknown protein [uncultured Sulfurovum sp.]|uniref:DUF4935 domain-containing protein n=1 Tax=uncultured Sulfurovum sp. TaxID=269237 RepID=A0A6S6T2J9_9BACT|nr:MAG: Unknown protein [uncultured Sulfurovum sp.]